MNGLFNSTTLDVMIGLFFIYLLLAIMCSSINEWVAGLLRLRAATLTKGIGQLLDCQEGPKSMTTPADVATTTGQVAAQSVGQAAGKVVATSSISSSSTNWLLEEFKKHPLIACMTKAKGTLPSYIPSRTFATALIDIVTPEHKGPISFDALRDGLEKLPNGDVKKALFALIQNANNDLETAQKNIEHWFDDTMDQVSGWYKRKAALVTFLVAVFLTLTTNADTIQITRSLWTNPTVRAQLVEEAKKPDANFQQNPSQHVLDSVGGVLPSWKLPADRKEWFERLLGWLLTVAAVSLGAPFWFDLLSKLANLRNAGQKPSKSSTPAATTTAAAG